MDQHRKPRPPAPEHSHRSTATAIIADTAAPSIDSPDARDRACQRDESATAIWPSCHDTDDDATRSRQERFTLHLYPSRDHQNPAKGRSMLRFPDVSPFITGNVSSRNDHPSLPPFAVTGGVIDVKMRIRRREEAFRLGVDARSLQSSMHR
jgi:hypothetical protein